MALLTTNVHKNKLVNLTTQYVSPQVFLFTNNHTPDYADTFGLYTEPTDGAYAQQPLLAGTISDSSGTAQDVFPMVTFPAMSADLDVYGWGLVDTATGTLIGASLFDGAPLTINAGNIMPLIITYVIGPC